eukprot:CAMPEP_0204608020 /NCGR_PEP_ID=MMETSP0661-20131031/60049_1 /ASSEMBLY_ACC=CAM_ASM_000606 /TAXON_ID=109239 /ORGANISM="Alexandrium margalefi, Strain AMGDE01CS-322" /LENGTH=495 /DNA_ID=CAMNT_0051619489 /DNA_START=53 /DNA_END=1540 /DNA_ORIENTATION=+
MAPRRAMVSFFAALPLLAAASGALEPSAETCEATGSCEAANARGRAALLQRRSTAAADDLEQVQEEEEQPTYVWKSKGRNSVCRLATWDRSSDGYGSAKTTSAGDLAGCKKKCQEQSGCKGIEFHTGGRCELWTKTIGYAKRASRYECWTLEVAMPKAEVLSSKGLVPEVLEQNDTTVKPGEEIRIMTAGSSNVMFGSWPDHLGNMLRSMGFKTDTRKPSIRHLVFAPLKNIPQCDDRSEWNTVPTPRFGKPGWSSWGFAFDNHDDCNGGYRYIAGKKVSCKNGWGCSTWDMVRVSDIAAAAKNSHVLMLSNWMNDRSQKHTKYACFAYKSRSLDEVVEIAFTDISTIVQRVRRDNPTITVLVMGLYPFNDHRNHVNGATRKDVDYLNGKMKAKLATLDKVQLVHYEYPSGVELFQKKHAAHPNCRADRLMAKKALEVLYERKIIARTLDLGSSSECPKGAATGDCASLSLPCCQLSAQCRVSDSRTCVKYGPGW